MLECVIDVASDLSFESTVCVGGVHHVFLLEMFIFDLSSPNWLLSLLFVKYHLVLMQDKFCWNDPHFCWNNEHFQKQLSQTYIFDRGLCLKTTDTHETFHPLSYTQYTLIVG